MKCCLQHFFTCDEHKCGKIIITHTDWQISGQIHRHDSKSSHDDDRPHPMTDHIRWPATHWRQQIHSLAQSQPVHWLTIQLQLRIPHTVAKALYELCILYDCTFNCHVIRCFNDVLSRSGDATFCRSLYGIAACLQTFVFIPTFLRSVVSGRHC